MKAFLINGKITITHTYIILLLITIGFILTPIFVKAQSVTGIFFTDDPDTNHYQRWGYNVLIAHTELTNGQLITIFKDGVRFTDLTVLEDSVIFASGYIRLGGLVNDFQASPDGTIWRAEPGGGQCTMSTEYGYRYCGIMPSDSDLDGFANNVDFCPLYPGFNDGCPDESQGVSVPNSLPASHTPTATIVALTPTATGTATDPVTTLTLPSLTNTPSNRPPLVREYQLDIYNGSDEIIGDGELNIYAEQSVYRGETTTITVELIVNAQIPTPAPNIAVYIPSSEGSFYVNGTLGAEIKGVSPSAFQIIELGTTIQTLFSQRIHRWSWSLEAQRGEGNSTQNIIIQFYIPNAAGDQVVRPFSTEAFQIDIIDSQILLKTTSEFLGETQAFIAGIATTVTAVITAFLMLRKLKDKNSQI